MESHLLLKNYFEKKRKRFPRFSLRSLARQIEVSPSFLSRVLAGKKAVPYGKLLRLCELLDLEPEMRRTLLDAHSTPAAETRLPSRGKRAVKSPLAEWEPAGADSNHLLTQWFYLPILELTTLPDYDGLPATVARRLGLRESVAESALRELARLELVENQGGRFRKTKKRLRWGSGKSVPEVRKFHELMLERARVELRENVDEASFARRRITGITLSVDPVALEQAKQKLTDCLYEIANELTQKPGTEIYHIAFQIFPLTRA